jgi:hypothetical protein
MTVAGSTGLIAASAGGPARGRPEAADGTPEQIHLTWGDDPSRAVVVSWASPGHAVRPRVRIGQRVITAAERAVPGGPGGAVGWTYHALVEGLRPGATYGYAVTADNDSNASDPFSATFTTAPEGRASFRFTSFGDLAGPDSSRAGPSTAAAYAVESFQPLFHLVNGDLADVGTAAGEQPQAWRDYANQVQASAAYRPWLPVPGSHRGAADRPPAAFLTRYRLPSNGVDGLDGRWYAFRVGTALFVCLSGDDVAYGGAGGRGYSGGAQTRWLESTLAKARGDASIDWIVVQLRQCACSSATAGPGSDLGIRREWLPLFDTYEVDLVLSGHDTGYERSFPVRGCDIAAGTDTATGAVTDTRRPHPVTTVDSGVFDTSQGTVHLVLGGGGEAADPGGEAGRPASGALGLGPAGTGPRTARVLTRPAGPVPDARVPGDEAPAAGFPAAGVPSPGSPSAGFPSAGFPSAGFPGAGAPSAAEAVEAATWSARRDASAGYGIAVFDVNPGSEAGGQTSVIVRYYHQAAADPRGQAGDPGQPGEPADDYYLLESFTLVRPRSDGRRWHPKS